MENNVFLFLLLLIEFLFFIIVYNDSGRELLNPNTATMGLLVVSLLFAVCGNMIWNNGFSFKSFWTLLVSTAAVPIAQFISKRSVRKHVIKTESYKLQHIDIRPWKKNILIFLSVVLTVGYVYDVLKRGQSSGAIGLSAIYAAKMSEKQGNMILRQGIKLTMATAYVDGFIFVNNISSEKRNREDSFYLIPVICGCICSVFTGVRTEILRLIIALVVYELVIYKEKTNWKSMKSLNRKTKRLLSLVIVGFLLAFYFMRLFIKSSDIGENKAYGLFMYLAYYIGSPWLVINQKIIRGLSKFRGARFGELTFATMYMDMIDFGLIKNNVNIKGQAFISIDPRNSVNGNADTMFGQSLVDFGTLGSIVTILVLYLILSVFYYKKIKNTYSGYYRNKSVIVFAFVYYVVGISFYSNALALMISVYYALTLILIWMIYCFYFGMRIKKRNE